MPQVGAEVLLEAEYSEPLKCLCAPLASQAKSRPTGFRAGRGAVVTLRDIVPWVLRIWECEAHWFDPLCLSPTPTAPITCRASQ